MNHSNSGLKDKSDFLVGSMDFPFRPHMDTALNDERKLKIWIFDLDGFKDGSHL